MLILPPMIKVKCQNQNIPWERTDHQTYVQDGIQKGSIPSVIIILRSLRFERKQVIMIGNSLILSTSPLLFELIVRLYKLLMKYYCSVQVVHVAGTRMIQQGTDGLSRGDLLEGVLKGKATMSFIPLHLGPIEAEPSLKTILGL